MNSELESGDSFRLIKVLGIFKSKPGAGGLYGLRRDSFYVETYPVVNGANGQSLGAGSPLTQEELGALVTGASKDKFLSTGFLPSEVLSFTPDITGRASYAFWCKPCVAPLRYTGWPKSLIVPYPALLMVVTAEANLKVFALKGKKRPSLSGKVYEAPFWNISGNGRVCTGNCKLPNTEIALADKVEAWKNIWYNSVFSSAYRNEYGRKPLQEFWKELEGQASFPNNKLVSSKITVADVLKESVLA